VAQAAPFRARGDGAAACRGHGHDVAWLVSRGPPLRRHSVAGDRSTDERAADRRLIEPLRCHHGGSQRVPASMRCPAALGWPKPARLSGGIHAGVVGGRSGAAGSTSLCSLGSGSWWDRLRSRRGRTGPRGRPDRRDRDTTRGRVRHFPPPPAVVLGQRRHQSRGRARSRACSTPILCPRHLHASALPPSARAAAGADGHDQGRQGSPSRCNCWAARPAAALRKSRPRQSLSCWRGLPLTRPRSLPRPGPPPAARPSGRARQCQPGHGRLSRAP
jgi:hypothetical protein